MSRLVAALLLGLAVAAGSAGAADPWRTVADRADGFSIAVPAAWQVVPHSTPRLSALVVRLRKAKRPALANQFAEIAATRRATHTVYPFQSFAWPAPKGPIVPDVTVKTDRLGVGTTSAALPLLARQIAKALAASKNATASAPVLRQLPAGRAYEVSGTTQLSKSLRNRYVVYLLIHGRTLYSVSFRGPATAVETRIVESFRFS